MPIHKHCASNRENADKSMVFLSVGRKIEKTAGFWLSQIAQGGQIRT
jgi:hypothetical protein